MPDSHPDCVTRDDESLSMHDHSGSTVDGAKRRVKHCDVRVLVVLVQYGLMAVLVVSQVHRYTNLQLLSNIVGRRRALEVASTIVTTDGDTQVVAQVYSQVSDTQQLHTPQPLRNSTQRNLRRIVNITVDTEAGVACEGTAARQHSVNSARKEIGETLDACRVGLQTYIGCA